jgi:hypothetical protein
LAASAIVTLLPTEIAIACDVLLSELLSAGAKTALTECSPIESALLYCAGPLEGSGTVLSSVLPS